MFGLHHPIFKSYLTIRLSLVSMCSEPSPLSLLNIHFHGVPTFSYPNRPYFLLLCSSSSFILHVLSQMSWYKAYHPFKNVGPATLPTVHNSSCMFSSLVVLVLSSKVFFSPLENKNISNWNIHKHFNHCNWFIQSDLVREIIGFVSPFLPTSVCSVVSLYAHTQAHTHTLHPRTGYISQDFSLLPNNIP